MKRAARLLLALLVPTLAVALCGCQTDRDGVRINLSEAVRAYRQQVDKKPGREQLDRMVASLPAEQLTDLGVMYEREERLDDAARAYYAAIQRDLYYARAYTNLGNVLRKQGKSEEALTRYRQAMAADPGSFEAANNFADLCAAEGTYLDEAISRLVPVMDKAGTMRPYALDTLGWLYHQRGQDELARQSLAAALADTNAIDATLRTTIQAHLVAVREALRRTGGAEGPETEARRLGE